MNLDVLARSRDMSGCNNKDQKSIGARCQEIVREGGVALVFILMASSWSLITVSRWQIIWQIDMANRYGRLPAILSSPRRCVDKMV